MQREDVRVSIPEPTYVSNYCKGFHARARTYIIMINEVDLFNVFPMHVFIIDATLTISFVVCF